MPTSPHALGLALCVMSACAFALMAILAKGAYAQGIGVPALLTWRFAIAAAVLWALAAILGRLRCPRPPARTVAAALALGAVLYSAEAAAYFGALEHLDAALASLLLYVYPALVCAGAVALGRDRLDARRASALGLAGAGTALVLAGGGAGALVAVGVALALGSALAYAAYILVADALAGRLDPLVLSALVSTGAGLSLAGFAGATGTMEASFSATGWTIVVTIALACTALAIATFVAGLRLVGPATAAIASTAEPAVTVLLAVAVLGERLAGVQALGGALVLGAVVVLHARVRPRLRGAPLPAR